MQTDHILGMIDDVITAIRVVEVPDDLSTEGNDELSSGVYSVKLHLEEAIGAIERLDSRLDEQRKEPIVCETYAQAVEAYGNAGFNFGMPVESGSSRDKEGVWSLKNLDGDLCANVGPKGVSYPKCPLGHPKPFVVE